MNHLSMEAPLAALRPQPMRTICASPLRNCCSTVVQQTMRKEGGNAYAVTSESRMRYLGCIDGFLIRHMLGGAT